MKALLLAAGEGQRLRPLTHLIPKPLIPVLDIPLIDYSIAALAEASVSEIIVNAFHLPEKLEAHLGESSSPVPMELVIEARLLGTGGAVRNVRDHLTDEPFIIANADVLHGIDLKAACAAHEKSAPLATLLLRDEGWQGAGGFWAREDGTLGGYLAPGESPPAGTRAGLFTGLHVLSPEILGELPDEDVFCIVQRLYRPLLEKGAPIRAQFVSDVTWHDLGTPTSYADACIALLGELRSGSVLAARARKLLEERGYESVEPGIWTPHPWLPDTPPEVQTPVFIGQDVQVGYNVQIGPGAIVGAGAHLDDDTSLERCVVWPGTHVRGHVWKDRIFYEGRKSLGL